MKKNLFSYGIAFMVFTCLTAFDFSKTSITGKITPVDGITNVWVISGADTIRTQVISGTFSIDVNPGVYKLVVDAKDPYKDIELENLEVKTDQTLDVGVIVLKP